MPTARTRSALSRIPLGTALIAIGAVLVAINIGAAIMDVRAAHDRAERRAQRDFSNVTSVLAEQTAAALEAADVVLRDAAWRALPQPTQLPQLAAILVFDGEGHVVGRSPEEAEFDPALAERMFIALRNSVGEGLYVSEPYFGGSDGKRWRFVLVRRIPASDGAAVAIIEIESFERLYRAIDLGEGAFITLLSRDGVVVTRVPDLFDVRGRKVAAGGIMGAVERGGRFEGWTTSPISGERVLLSVAEVRSFPFIVASGSAEAAVFAPWRAEARYIALRTLLTSAAMLGLIAVAAWGLALRERTLQRREKRFRAMVEYSSDAVILTRPKQGGIFYVSPAIERLLGYRAEELLGREVMDLVHPASKDEALKLRDELLRSPGKVSVDEGRIMHRDGSWRWMEIARSNLLHEPSVGAVVMNLRDISERKGAEAERARLEQRLRQAEKMEAVGRLAGGIAHDFNNILGGILGYAEMLAEKAPPGTPLKRYAENVLTGANRAGALVEQILSYSRSQRGRRVPVEWGRVVGESLELVRGALTGAIRLEVALPTEPLYVVGDPTQLHRVTMNLCTNAIHAMAQGGRLRVSLEAAAVETGRTLSHTTLHAGSYACLTVQDEGSGMDSETLARIFEPFFTTKEVDKGTGLGLSLVYGIVTDSGGAIDVASAPGRGSRFSIYLPRVDSPVIAADPAQAPVARGKGERILVVDDEEAILAVTSEVLRNLGYEPLACVDGHAALAAFHAERETFHAVMTDEVMPGLTGTQLARAVHAERPQLPVILMSGYIGPMLSERALAAGIAEVLKKPVQSRELAAALGRAFGRG